MKRKSLMILTTALVLVIALTGATMAWFSASSDPITNKFGTGTVKVELKDMLGEVVFPEDGMTNVTPGDTYDKEVWAINTGTLDSYIRIQLVPEWSKADLSTEFIALGLNTTDWVAGEGNWYYYKFIASKDEVTSKLLDGVTFSGAGITNAYQDATFKIIVKAEAVQASNYAFVDEWNFAAGTLVPAIGVEAWVASAN